MTARTDQISAAELKNMPPEEISKAYDEGRLSELMAGRDPGREPSEFVPPDDAADQGARGRKFRSKGDWVRSLPPDEIVRRYDSGELDDYMRGEVD